MKVNMKKYCKYALDYACSKFPKKGQWAENIIAKDAYLAGYKMAMQEAEATVDYKVHFNGLEDVEVEFKDGEHQL
jgi:hypothetical protein